MFGDYFVIILGIIFILVGIVFLLRYIKKKKFLTDNDSCSVDGVIVDNKVNSNNSDDGSMYTYYPIYEFVFNGNKIRYESKYGVGRDMTGEIHQLYYNKRNCIIFEVNSMKKDLLIGVIFFVLGIGSIICIIPVLING